MLISANVHILLLVLAWCWVLDMCVTTYSREQLISVNNNTLRPLCHLVSFRPVNNLELQKSANLCHPVTVQKSVIQRDTPPSYLLKAGLVNVQSVRNKIDHIVEAIISHDLDILILTETWLTTDDKDQFFIRALNIKGYKFYSFPRGNNTGHGGVGIIIRSSINIKSASQTLRTAFCRWI